MTNGKKQGFFAVAVTRPVVTNAIKVALIVGTILACINHGQKILNESITSQQVIQIFLTYLVPYCVATYSAVRALEAHESKNT